jgi:hypothetical protein
MAAPIQYELRDREGRVEKGAAKFDGAGIELFAVGAGPTGRIFGSTALPLELFGFTRNAVHLSPVGSRNSQGQAGETGGRIFSFDTYRLQM